MKNTVKLLLLGVFLFGITASRAQIATSTGGAGMVVATVPITNNVGIGTTNPTGKLDIMGPYAVVSLDPNSPATANFRTAGSVQLAITTSSTPPYITALQAKHSTIAGNAYPLALNPLGGKVGVGTATPNATLDVNGNIAVGGLNAGSDTSPLSKKIAAYNYQSIEAGAIDFLDFNTNRHATSIAFRAKNASNVPQEFMRIVGQDGNVGIGTTTPMYKLDVNGQTSVGGGITNHWVFGINGIGSGGSGVWFDYNNAMSNTALIQAESQGIAYRNISINPYGGNVGIGTTDPKNKLSVNGTIWAKEVKVSLTDAADWVFDTNYKLKPLADVEKYINANKHLPEVPSAEEFRQNDMNVSEMSNKLLQKIEELTLYAIEQDKKAALQQKEIDRLKTENENYKSLAERLSAIEKEFKK